MKKTMTKLMMGLGLIATMNCSAQELKGSNDPWCTAECAMKGGGTCYYSIDSPNHIGDNKQVYTCLAGCQAPANDAAALKSCNFDPAQALDWYPVAPTTAQCKDGAQNGTETDIDCGGAGKDGCGATCAIGKKCEMDTDCQSARCDASKTCQNAPTMMKNDGEMCSSVPTDPTCKSGGCLPPDGFQFSAQSVCGPKRLQVYKDCAASTFIALDSMRARIAGSTDQTPGARNTAAIPAGTFEVLMTNCGNIPFGIQGVTEGGKSIVKSDCTGMPVTMAMGYPADGYACAIAAQ